VLTYKVTSEINLGLRQATLESQKKMIIKKILITIFLTTNIFFAQNSEKYFIYFKDKGIDKTAHLSKASTDYKQAINSLSERSIKRRIKTSGENFISFEDLLLNEDYINTIKKSGAKIVWELKWFNAVSAFLTDEQYQEIKKLDFVEKLEKVKKIYSKKDEIEEAKLDKKLHIGANSYSLDYGNSLTQYELSDIPIIHNYGFSGEGVLIGILDAGFAWETHPALQSRSVLAERDFVYGDKNTDDNDANHGTAVFSLIGGFDEGNIIGPAYSAQYVLAKTENIFSETHIEEDNYAAAMEWMDSIGVDITTTSLGYNDFDDDESDYTYADMDGKTTIVTQASELAFLRGILTINSAGNEGNKSWKYITAPADGLNTITVGSVDENRILVPFSSVGPTADGRIKPEVVALGVSCYHAKAYSNLYGYGQGTSYSAPIAAGITAQLLSAFPYLSNEQIRSIVIEACDSTGSPNNQYGYGLLSARAALEFPNIKLPDESTGGQTSLINKLFIDSNGIVTDSVFMLYTINSQENLSKNKMLYKGNNIFSAVGYTSAIGDTVKFWFEYQDSTMSTKRYPVEGNYTFIDGSSIVDFGVRKGTENPIPDQFKLSRNYPNPFNPLTWFTISVPDASFITINIYNILGQKVRTLVSKNHTVGIHRCSWDGTNDYGVKVSSGVYIYTANLKQNFKSKKMIYLK
jgi:serine protease AprX